MVTLYAFLTDRHPHLSGNDKSMMKKFTNWLVESALLLCSRNEA